MVGRAREETDAAVMEDDDNGVGRKLKEAEAHTFSRNFFFFFPFALSVHPLIYASCPFLFPPHSASIVQWPWKRDVVWEFSSSLFY